MAPEFTQERKVELVPQEKPVPKVKFTKPESPMAIATPPPLFPN